MTFSITEENNVTTIVITECAPASYPGLRFQPGIPAPVEYTVNQNTVTIKFSEVQHNKNTE